MSPRIEFWFEFASTYSYPAAARIETEARARGARVAWRPFLLGPIFAAQGWNDSPFNLVPAKGRAMWRDVARTCARLGLPFRRPQVFPRNGLLAARVACRFEAEPWVAEFVRRIFHANFADDRDVSDPEVVGAVLAGLGQPARERIAAATTAEARAALRDRTEQARALGIFGAPSFVAGDELFWGHDRLDAALDAACAAARVADPGGSPSGGGYQIGGGYRIETARLRIRPFEPERDAGPFGAIAADPPVHRFIGDGSRWTAERVAALFETQARHLVSHGFALGALEERAPGPDGAPTLVGMAGLAPLGSTREVEIGWWLRPDRWGRGYASEAGRALLFHAFERLGLPRVVAIAHPENRASQRVMDRIGLVFESRASGRELGLRVPDVEVVLHAAERRPSRTATDPSC